MNPGVIDLFDWLKNERVGLLDLSSSGVHGPATLGELGVRLDDLPMTSNDQYGHMLLRELIASRYGLSTANIAITPGASMANYAIITALASAGRPVVMEKPVYRPFPAVAEAVTGKAPIYFERQIEDSFRLDPKLPFEATPNPQLVITTNLHNPSGALEPFDTFYTIADQLAPSGGCLLVDEIFLPFIEGMDWKSAAAGRDNIVAVGSFTKAWGLSGLRIGWVIGNEQLIHQITRLMDYMHVIQPPATEEIAFRMLRDGIADQLLVKARTRARENAPVAYDTLDQLRGVRYRKADGGIVVWIETEDGRPTEPWCDALIKGRRVLVQPGKYFGRPDGLRIGFGADRSTVINGLEALKSTYFETIGSAFNHSLPLS